MADRDHALCRAEPESRPRARIRIDDHAPLSRERRSALRRRQRPAAHVCAVDAQARRAECPMSAYAARSAPGMRGFTLIELTIALVLLALMASVIYGALGLAGQSADRGEAKVDATAGMRLTQEFLRAQLE